MTLKLIGYWRNDESPEFPMPQTMVDETWDAGERARVIQHMRNAIKMPYAAGGRSWCRFNCGNRQMGNLEFTDGLYLWPEGLVHYLEQHHVKLPEPVTRHMLTQGHDERVLKALEYSYTFETDVNWWISITNENL